MMLSGSLQVMAEFMLESNGVMYPGTEDYELGKYLVSLHKEWSTI